MTETLMRQAVEVMETHLSCPLCDRIVPPNTIINCTGINATRPHPKVALSWLWGSIEEYEAMYQDDTAYHEDMQAREGQSGFWQRDAESLVAAQSRLDAMEGILGPLRGKSLCDIGAGSGAFVVAAQMRGIQAYGLEPGPAMVRRARALGRNLAEGTWQAGAALDHLITAHDVMEHLTDSTGFLMALRDRLLPDGCLVVEMPELDAPNPVWKKHLRPKQHIALYTVAAAEDLYRRRGFVVVGFWRPLQGRLGKMAHLLQRREG